MLMGNLGLSSNEEVALVAFLKTLSDGYMPDSNNSFYSLILTALFVGVIVGIIVFIVIRRHKLRSNMRAHSD